MNFLFILSFLLFPAVSEAESLRLHVIDVGYADAILIQFPDDQTMLVDAGTPEAPLKLIPYFQSLSIHRLDTLVMTHPHDNHYGGVPALLKNFSIGRVFINGDGMEDLEYLKVLEEIKEKNIPLEVLTQGQVISSLPENIRVTVLHPKGGLKAAVNGNSIVLWFTYGRRSFLLTGDIEEKELDDILEETPGIEKTDCILIPHHGRTVTERLKEKFTNKIFAASYGPNGYGSLDPERLTQLKGRIFRTDLDGTIVIETDGDSLDVTTLGK